jgi:YHS domain-containing protein
MAIDPVCGMEVDEQTTKDKAMHEGETYYFCSKDCRDEFQASPVTNGASGPHFTLFSEGVWRTRFIASPQANHRRTRS